MSPSRASAALAIGIATMVAGCIAEPAPPSERPTLTVASPSASTSASPPAPPVSPEAGSGQISAADPTPEPTIPARLPTAAVHEEHGVRITIELERNPMPAGQPTWVTTTVTNTGSGPLFWDSDCDAAVWVRGSVAQAPWRNGVIHQEPLKTWKAYLLEHQGLSTVDRSVVFWPKSRVDQGEGACAEVGHLHRIDRGATLAQRARWDGFAFDLLTPPPQARIDLVGTFRYGPTEDSIRTKLSEAHLDAWIAGLPDAFLDPAEAVDIALTDPRLTAVLASHELRNGNGGLVRFDPATGAYEIGLIEENLPTARAHVVLVDARTGRIVGFVERDWDFRVDGFP